MIIEMTKNASQEEVNGVVEAIKLFHFEVQINKGEERTVIAVLGANTGNVDTENFQVLSGVEQVFRMQKPFKLASKDFKKDPTIITINDVQIGSEDLVVMAGPCSVESENQIIACACVAKEA